MRRLNLFPVNRGKRTSGLVSVRGDKLTRASVEEHQRTKSHEVQAVQKSSQEAWGPAPRARSALAPHTRRGGHILSEVGPDLGPLHAQHGEDQAPL